MPYGKMPDFVLFPLFGFTLVTRVRNFHGEIFGPLTLFHLNVFVKKV